MPLAPGDRLGPYEVVRCIGEGGMGRVWEALDPRMGRRVAIKTLASGRSQDRDRIRRFQQEARAAGALNHPHVLSVYDVGEEMLADGSRVPYLVTELLHGETLEARLRSGPLPVRRALELVRQVAEGLSAAHARGFLHRDLKPANVFLTDGDHVRILDFGLAKLVEDGKDTAAAGEGLPATALTRSGALLGTLGYMAPEQVKGEEPDARSDIFAVGVILWEALAGRKLYPQSGPYLSMKAVIEDDAPPLDGVRAEVPRQVAEVVATCLEKEPERRFQTATDLAFVLRALAAGAATDSAASSGPLRRVSGVVARASRMTRAGVYVALGLLAVLAAAVVAPWLAGRRAGEPPSPPPTVRHLTLARNDYAPAAAPDGSSIAFVSQRDGVPRVWLKELAGGGETPLTAGPDEAPRFAPDGSSLLFVRRSGGESQLLRQPFPGGEPVVLLRGVYAADWSPDGGRVVWVRSIAGGGSELGVLEPASGRLRPLASFDDRQVDDPRWSPDGRRIALLAGDDGGLLLVNAGSGGVVTLPLPAPWLGNPVSTAAWDGPEHLVVLAARGAMPGVATTPGTCLRLSAGGEPAAEILFETANWGQHLDLVPGAGASGRGVVFTAGFSNQSLWLESLGDEVSRPLTGAASIDRQPAISPDGRWVAFSSDRSGNLDLWRVEVANGRVARLTDHPASDWDPAISADGERLVWASDRTGRFEAWTAFADGSGVQRLTDAPFSVTDPVPSPDGRWIVFGAVGESGLWSVRFDLGEPPAAPRRVVEAEASLPRFSADGARLAYLAEGARGPEVVVVSWPVDGGKPVASFPVSRPSRTDLFLPGRAEWLGGATDGVLAVLDHGPEGLPHLALHATVPGGGARFGRRVLLDAGDGRVPETFDLAADGGFLVVSRLDLHQHLLLASGIRPPEG